jgi:hypothetical protein
VPWIAIAAQLVISATEGSAASGIRRRDLRDAAAAVQQLRRQHVAPIPRPRPLGRAAFAERVYLLLSLIAKSALAWQVYAGALAGS